MELISFGVLSIIFKRECSWVAFKWASRSVFRFTGEEHATSAVLFYCMTHAFDTAFSLGVVVKLLLHLPQDSAHNIHTKFNHCSCALRVCMRLDELIAVFMTQVF